MIQGFLSVLSALSVLSVVTGVLLVAAGRGEAALGFQRYQCHPRCCDNCLLSNVIAFQYLRFPGSIGRW